MSDLLDSGARQQFDSGAVRDIREGKGRMDLVPLELFGKRLKDPIILALNTYIQKGDTDNLWTAYDLFIDLVGWDIYTSIIEVSKQYEDGARKYAEDNWKKGMPVHCFIDSTARHYMKYRRGDQDEPHDRAVLWNIISGMWMHINKPEYIDLPFSAQREIKVEEEVMEVCHWTKLGYDHMYEVECNSSNYLLIKNEIDVPRYCPYCSKKIEVSEE